MKTFNRFNYDRNLMLERYYAPNETLPSGNTPLGKAKRKGIKGRKLKQVRRGADNPNWDTSYHPDFKIDVIKSPDDQNRQYIKYHHKPSGITYQVDSHNFKMHGKPVYEIGWDVPKNPKATLKDRIKTLHTAMKIGRSFQSRAPYGSYLWSRPTPNESNEAKERNRNTRSRLYGNEGMGPLTRNRSQFALVGRMPSPRQQQSGRRTRLIPYVGN